jgi:hypothetical protein
MRVLMFKEQFVPKVRDGSKPYTIRKTARCKPGHILSLRRWMGLPYRSKQEVLMETVCVAVTPVEINQWGADLGDVFVHCPDTLARGDGFSGWEEMREWFRQTHGLPFHGVIIEWEPPVAVDAGKGVG